jgi:hypothetical protein
MLMENAFYIEHASWASVDSSFPPLSWHTILQVQAPAAGKTSVGAEYDWVLRVDNKQVTGKKTKKTASLYRMRTVVVDLEGKT